jgi:hypothetical protein
MTERETRYKKHLGRGEEGVVTSLRWQTDIKALPLNITARDLNFQPLNMGSYHAMSLEPSPRSGLDVDLVWTQLPHSVDTHSRLHTPDTRVCAYRLDIDGDSNEVLVREGPQGPGRRALHGRRLNFHGSYRSFWLRMFRII